MTLRSSVPLTVPGLHVVEHHIDVPLRHSDPDGETLTVFAREVADPDGLDRPFLVFLQGGPGNEAPRPTRMPTSPPWLDRALADYRVLMLDQRGTGLSAPAGTLPGLSPAEQAERLTHYRADAIVADCEVVRRDLGVDRWSVLGQSFGGFCVLRYLSAAPEGLREAFLTGGVPAVGRDVDEVYAATYRTMRERNRRFHATYPHDAVRLRDVLDRCAAGEVRLPTGEAVTPARFRTVGNQLGMSDGAAHVHHLLERNPASSAFAHDLAAMLPFGARNPLYAVVHESCWADGQATRWSADRVLPEDFRADPALLTGEHVFPSLFADDPALAPLAEAAHLLAEHPWPRLYDEEALAACDVPCAAAVYAEDAYVDRAFSEETARLVPTMRTWVTNELEHNGLRVDGERVLDRLIGMARGRLA